MTAKATTTPDAMLADVLGNAKRASARVNQIKSDEAPTTEKKSATSHQTAPKKTSRSNTGSVSVKAPTPPQDGSHKLQIIIPAELYMAMQMHKCLYGQDRGERSLKDIGINAISAYVADSLKEVRGYETHNGKR